MQILKTKAMAALSLMMFLVLATGCMMAEDRTFFKQGDEIGDQVGSLLVANGLCKETRKMCAGYVYGVNDLIGGGGFLFETIGVRDPELIKKIVDIIQKKFEETPKIRRIKYVAFEGDGFPPHIDRVPNRDVLLYEKNFRR